MLHFQTLNDFYLPQWFCFYYEAKVTVPCFCVPCYPQGSSPRVFVQLVSQCFSSKISLTTNRPRDRNKRKLLGSGWECVDYLNPVDRPTPSSRPTWWSRPFPFLACNRSPNDIELVPLELIHSSRDALRKDREAYLIERGYSPKGINKRGEI